MIYFLYVLDFFFVDDEIDGDTTLDGVDVENFGFPYTQFAYPYLDFQNE